jgi:hypothetical protein
MKLGDSIARFSLIYNAYVDFGQDVIFVDSFSFK